MTDETKKITLIASGEESIQYLNDFVEALPMECKQLGLNIKTQIDLVKFARKCDQCGKLFNEGYCIGAGEGYYCSKPCLLTEMTEKEFEKLYDSGNGDSYWTSWECPEDMLYYEDGTEIEE